MRTIFLACILVFLCNSIWSQVNWKLYDEPDGDLLRLTLSPASSFVFADRSLFGQGNQFDVIADVELDMSYRKVDDKNILNLFTGIGPGWDFVSDDGVRNGDLLGTYYFLIDHKRYFNKRDGFFINIEPAVALFFDNSREDQLDENASFRLSLGYGRLERISPVYHAFRIMDQYNQSTKDFVELNEAQIFDLASFLQRQSYSNLLDTRMRNLQNQADFLTKIDEMGFSLSEYFEIANMIDAFVFERPSTISNGLQNRLGMNTTNLAREFNPSLFYDFFYGRAINRNWYSSYEFQLQYNLDESFVNPTFSMLYLYFPTQRTEISFRLSGRYNDFNFGEFNVSNRNTMRYFVSPATSLSANLSIELFDIGGSISNSRIRLDFGVLHYIY